MANNTDVFVAAVQQDPTADSLEKKKQEEVPANKTDVSWSTPIDLSPSSVTDSSSMKTSGILKRAYASGAIAALAQLKLAYSAENEKQNLRDIDRPIHLSDGVIDGGLLGLMGGAAAASKIAPKHPLALAVPGALAGAASGYALTDQYLNHRDDEDPSLATRAGRRWVGATDAAGTGALVGGTLGALAGLHPRIPLPLSFIGGTMAGTVGGGAVGAAFPNVTGLDEK